MSRLALLLILALLVVAAVALYLFRAKLQASATSAAVRPRVDAAKISQTPVSFGYKTAWYAVRSTDSVAVANALRLSGVHVSDWGTGIDTALEYRSNLIFVTPLINGWILSVGSSFLSDADESRKARLLALSRQFGEAQFFGSMRVSDAYIWAQARDGALVCYFENADGVLHREGTEAELEKRLGLHYFENESQEAKMPDYYDRRDLKFPVQDDVLKVAGFWSVNPAHLDTVSGISSSGLLGRYRN